MSCGRGCLAGFESFETSFSLKNVAAWLDSTKSVSLCQAINKNMKECDRPVRRRFVTAGLYVLTNARVFSLFLAFCLSADCLPEKWISDGVLSIRCVG